MHILIEEISYVDFLLCIIENRSGEWGDHVTLQAAADSVCMYILFVFTLIPNLASCRLLPYGFGLSIEIHYV